MSGPDLVSHVEGEELKAESGETYHLKIRVEVEEQGGYCDLEGVTVKSIWPMGESEPDVEFEHYLGNLKRGTSVVKFFDYPIEKAPQGLPKTKMSTNSEKCAFS